ncbi:hypothetical protein [Paenibacillus amylolyticus]|uniref:hypothetical protein n=1 Tax=Paenibacillus amylolyticus TaxID=1451 RepID=UPI00286A3A8B|nr:hypothetical protein [Paenibacillus amylolyticus]
MGVMQKVVKRTKSILEKQSARLRAFYKKATSEAYAHSRIFTYKVESKNPGITAIERTIRDRNGAFAERRHSF